MGRGEVKEKVYHLFNVTYLDPLGHTKSEKSLPVSVHGQGIALCLPPPVHGVQQPGCQDLGPGAMLVILPTDEMSELMIPYSVLDRTTSTEWCSVYHIM